MADNVVVTAGVATYTAAADEAVYSGDTAKLQVTRLVHIVGAEGSKAIHEVYGAATPAAAAYGATVRLPVITTAHLITAASANPTIVKASAGTLKSVHVFNNSDVAFFLKFHNTSGAPTAGTGVVFTVGVNAGQYRDVVLPDGGRAFTTGIGMTTVTGMADNDTAAVAVNAASIEVCFE